MAINVMVTRDFDHMSAVAADVVKKEIVAVQKTKPETILRDKPKPP